MIRDFANDNVCYLELRTTPRQTFHMTKTEYLKTVLNAIRECETQYPTIQVKLLPSIDRVQGIESADENLAIILELLKESYGDLIVGIDFSGDPTKSSFSLYKSVLEKAKKNGLKLAVHCGEIENDTEIMEMIEFGVDRIGHGTFIEGKALELVLERNIPIECCLTSNVKSKTVKTYDDHHLKKLLELKHNVVICVRN